MNRIVLHLQLPSPLPKKFLMDIAHSLERFFLLWIQLKIMTASVHAAILEISSVHGFDFILGMQPTEESTKQYVVARVQLLHLNAMN